jgi:homospermidine synthase
VLEHGANPGMVSHLAKQALVEIATAMLQRGLATDPAALDKSNYKWPIHYQNNNRTCWLLLPC